MHWACEKQSSIFLVLWSESWSGKCAKFHTVAAGNNRDHLTRSLYYCLFVPHIFIFVCCSSCLFPFVMNRILIFNATPTEKLQTFPPFYNELHRSHVLFVKVVYSFYLWRVDLDLLVQLWLHQIKSFTLSLLHRNTYPAQHMSKNKKTALTTRSRYGRYPQQHSITVTGCTWHHLHILVTALLFCHWKARAASAQNFTQWQQATIEITRHAHFVSACSRHIYLAEVAGVTFSDSDSAPVPKFLNPDPAILQIWESDSCSDSGYSHRSNRNLPMFFPKKRPQRFLLLPKWKSGSGFGSGFPKIIDSGSGSGSERKTQNPAGVDSGNPDPVPPLIYRSCSSRTSRSW